MDFSYSYLILVLPLVTFLFLGLMGTRLSRKAAGVVGTTMMGITAVIAYTIALDYFFGTTQGQIVDGIRQQLVAWDLTWLEFSEKLVIKVGFLLDPISAMMLMIITTVSFLVHLYSLGYMQDHHHEYE